MNGDLPQNGVLPQLPATHGFTDKRTTVIKNWDVKGVGFEYIRTIDKKLVAAQDWTGCPRRRMTISREAGKRICALKFTSQGQI